MELGRFVKLSSCMRPAGRLIAATKGRSMRLSIIPALLLAVEGDPHAALRENHTHAIVLYPECNFLSWGGAVDYRKRLPDLKTITYRKRATTFSSSNQSCSSV
jgi:hypothetical protein